MPRITINVPEEVEKWLEREADRLNWSKADAGGECIKLLYRTADHIDVQQSDVMQDTSRLDDLESRVAELEQRLGDEPTAEVEPRASDTGDPDEVALDLDELPNHIDHADARAAVRGALDVLDREGEAKFSTISGELLPEHDLGYGEGARNRDGAWWKKVVLPSMKANGVAHRGGGVWVGEE